MAPAFLILFDPAAFLTAGLLAAFFAPAAGLLVALAIETSELLNLQQ